jgi:phosphomevalonate kinase
MSVFVTASSPGKVILSGEYAVLDKAPAICMAVNCRAEVIIEKCNNGISRVESSGYHSKKGEFESLEKGILWRDDLESFAVIDAVWQVIDNYMPIDQNISLNTISFVDEHCNKKLGLGSSAAIIVALIAAVKKCDDPEKIKILAHQAHKKLQGGLGSGVDIATCLFGGLLKFQIENFTTKSLSWPDGLYFRLIWTGSSASTKDKLTRFIGGGDKSSRRDLVGASKIMATHWQSGDAEKILAGYENYCESLYDFSCDYNLGIFKMGHEALFHEAKKKNLIYKPCGAGGGDIGILLGLNREKLDKFCGSMSKSFKKLDYKLSIDGVRIEV